VIIGSASGKPGQTVDVPINFVASSPPVSALQFDVLLPQGISFVSLSAGPAATAATKDARAGTTSTGARVIVFGANQNAIGTGSLATLKVQLGASLSASTLALTVAQLLGADAKASAVAVSGVAGSLQVTH
jgi:hypothetical protein